MKIYMVRHGQTETNKNNKLLGVTDEDINDTGKLQILNVKKKLGNIHIDICFASPLKRTMQTSKIICENDIPIVIDNRLVERGFGILEGESGKNKYTLDFWDYYKNKKEYGVEPLQDLFCRTESFLDYLKANYKDKTILIVSHAATIRALHFNIVGFNNNTCMLNFKIDNGQVLEYNIKE